MPFNLGVTELVVLLVIGLLLFGHKLPGMMRWLGSSLMEFKKEMSSVTDELRGPVK